MDNGLQSEADVEDASLPPGPPDRKLGSAGDDGSYQDGKTKRDSLADADSKKRLTEISALRTHIINYSNTRTVYEAYRKAGYSKKFLEEHREEITLHKAAKQALDTLQLQKIPRIKELSKEYAEVLAEKKELYHEYRKVKDEVQELLIAQKNVASLYDAERKEEDNV